MPIDLNPETKAIRTDKLARFVAHSFDTITKLEKGNIDSTIKDCLDSGKTLFVRFIASEG